MVVGPSLHFNCWLLFPTISPSIFPSLYMYVPVFLVCLWFPLRIRVVVLDRFLAWITNPITFINCILRTVKIHWVNSEMMIRRIMFDEIICQTSSDRFRKDAVTDLDTSILWPIKTHTHGFCASLMRILVDDAVRSVVVSMNWCGQLGVDHLLKGDYYWLLILGFVEKCLHFCLHCW